MTRLVRLLHRLDDWAMDLFLGPNTLTGARRSTGRRWSW